MMRVLDQAEKAIKEARELREILGDYGDKDNFSSWLYMHSFRELADELRPKSVCGLRLVSVLKKYLYREILRMNHTPLVIEGIKIFNLEELVDLLRSIDPAKIQDYSDNDIFSSWLDRKGYTDYIRRATGAPGEQRGRSPLCRQQQGLGDSRMAAAAPLEGGAYSNHKMGGESS